ncbi:MAG TPA: hypothetical protein VMN57_06190 [Anaerolineales bacterium]|nr:hypothetical protein [Anaerolineales bacterium]
MFIRIAYVVLTLLLAACRAGGAAPEASETPPATPAPAPTPESPLFTLHSDAPVFRRGGPGDWYGSAVEPGAVVLHEDRLHLFFNGFTGWPARSSVGLAVSTDGMDWTLAFETSLLDSSLESFVGFTFFVSSVIRLDSGDWAMYLYTLDEGRDGAPGGILAATAPALEGPWTLVPGYALAPGEPGGWDAGRVTQPHVLKVGDAYRMYFAGYENDRLQGDRAIGLAISQDGLTWEKRPDPVLGPSDELGAWDSYRVFQPRVLQIEAGYLMLYKANVSVGRAEAWGFAHSADGLNWERYAGNPLIDEQTYGVELRRHGIAELVSLGGELFLFLEILERVGGAYHHGNAEYFSNIYLFTTMLDRLE